VRQQKNLVRRVPRLADDDLTVVRSLEDEDDLVGAMIAGDFSGLDCSALTLRECRFAGATLTGSRLARATLIDCVVADSDLSGTDLRECKFERTEFRHCRLSGVQAQAGRFNDVAILDCKIDGANFRMTVWERSELRDSNFVDSDFYGARLPAIRIHGCDLANVDFSKCDLVAGHLQRSRLDGIRGGDSLRGATIGSDQVIPAAIALFDAIGISVDDNE
jgi:uncharacterized protein YjbI with pentapeptide repeats